MDNTVAVTLQKLVLPSGRFQQHGDLHYRSTKNATMRDGHLAIQAGDTVSFNTYFNCLRLHEWNHYAILGKLQLRLKLLGDFDITIFGTVPDDMHEGSFKDVPLLTKRVSALEDRWEEMDLPFLPEGVLFFTLTALDDGCCLDGSFVSINDLACVRPRPCIAIVICTYHRELQLIQCLQLLRREIKNLDGARKIQLIVIDNASHLTQANMGKDVHLIHNINLGGAGGFTRGIVEVVGNPQGFTHLILMDDDAEVIPNSLQRAVALLLLCRNKFQHAIIGGAMLDIDNPSLQYASLEFFDKKNKRHTTQANRDLSLYEPRNNAVELCHLTAEKGRYLYTGWWFCLIPVTRNLSVNLPLPLFISGDDVEYGVRHSARQGKWMRLDGIGSLHEVFQNKKRSDVHRYFALRNRLIRGALYRLNQPLLIKAIYLVGKILLGLKRFEPVTQKAYMDFIAGPELLHKHPDLLALQSSFAILEKKSWFQRQKMNVAIIFVFWRHYKRIQKKWNSGIGELTDIGFWNRYLCEKSK